jgi:2-iminoacetate synthase ThiH
MLLKMKMDSDSPTPKTLVYNITSLCNNNCLFCYYDKEHGNVPYGKISSDLQKEFSAGARKLVLQRRAHTSSDIIK